MIKAFCCFGLILLIASSTSCRSRQASPEKREIAITVVNAYSNLFFDSLELEQYFLHNAVQDSVQRLMRDFYNVRNFQYAWFDKQGFGEQALNFWNLQRNYISLYQDSSFINPLIEQIADSVGQHGRHIYLPDSLRLRLEFDQTLQFYHYAQRAFTGDSRLDPNELKWFIPRKKVSLTGMLDSLIANQAKEMPTPGSMPAQFARLKDRLAEYSQIEKNGGWGTAEFSRDKYNLGDSASELIWVKNRLLISKDLKQIDSGAEFNQELVEALIKFQRRHGLAADGVLGPATARELNRPVNDLIRQILVNIERLRWLPAEPEGDYLLVNIPDYQLHLYAEGKHIGKIDVVVGSTQHNTVIFNDKLKYIVFSPYWNVPPGILKNEVLPAIARDPDYLRRNNMEWHNGSVRQKPGPRNSLGLVKFLFPNSYNIYLHDTPSKNLFREDSRAFSHGCIRVAEPVRLAEWILREDSAWNREKMHEAMNSGKERFVLVKKEIAVIIGYFTTWVDGEGNIQFRKDIYGHDAAMARKLFNE